MIQTEEMQWTYEIRGSHPQYKIPTVEGGRLKNKLNNRQALLLAHAEKKNFMKANLQATKYASPQKSLGVAATNRSVNQLGGQSRDGGSPPRR